MTYSISDIFGQVSQDDQSVKQEALDIEEILASSCSLNLLMLLLYKKRQDYPADLVRVVPDNIRLAAMGLVHPTIIRHRHDFPSAVMPYIGKLYNSPKMGPRKLWPFTILEALYEESGIPNTGVVGVDVDFYQMDDALDQRLCKSQTNMHIFDVCKDSKYEEFDNMKSNLYAQIYSVFHHLHLKQLEILSSYVMKTPVLISPMIYHLAFEAALEQQPSCVKEPVASWLPEYVNKTISDFVKIQESLMTSDQTFKNYTYGPSVLQ